MPTVQGAFGEMVGTARCAFAHPTNSPSLRAGASRPGMTNGDMTQKCMPHQRNLPVVPICRGLPQLISPPNQWLPWLVSFPIEGPLAIVTDVGSGMRWTHIAERNHCATSGVCADGEVVWFWRPDAGAKVRGCKFAERRWQKSPVTEESTKDTVKTIAQGRPEAGSNGRRNTNCFH